MGIALFLDEGVVSPVFLIQVVLFLCQFQTGDCIVPVHLAMFMPSYSFNHKNPAAVLPVRLFIVILYCLPSALSSALRLLCLVIKIYSLDSSTHYFVLHDCLGPDYIISLLISIGPTNILFGRSLSEHWLNLLAPFLEQLCFLSRFCV